MTDWILRITCPDRVGVVAAVAKFLADQGFFIIESQQYGDPDTNLFFMRVQLSDQGHADAAKVFSDLFMPVAKALSLNWKLTAKAFLPRVVLMVSKMDHCLNDLLYRTRSQQLPVEIAAIVSNHEDCRWLADMHGVPYTRLEVTAQNKPKAEEDLRALILQHRMDFIVLARYMQILSDEFCRDFAGRIINIHHSFLPSFKGAKPYHQAHDRGVKLIGATAHYVTGDLDEGPIIAQGVEAVSHAHDSDAMVAMGRDIEARVLARAVQWHAQGRIFLNGQKTVVFTD